MNCSKCGGSGSIPCPDCGGSGQVPYLWSIIYPDITVTVAWPQNWPIESTPEIHA